MKALSAADMRTLNRKTLFDIVRRDRQVTRVELAKETGMSGPSILTIVDEFVESGILTPAGTEETTLGRRPLRLSFNPDVMLSIGVEFEGNYLSAGAVNLDGNISCQTVSRVPTRINGAFFDVIIKSVGRIEDELKQVGKNYYGIGISIPGVVDVDARVLCFAPYIGVERPLDVSDMIKRMEDKFSQPVYLENDVNACAIGEYYIRQCDKNSDLVYVSIGAGLGAGLVLNGKLRHGSHYLCGEIGYTVKDSSSPVARNKTGWLEQRISVATLERLFGKLPETGALPDEAVHYIVSEIAPFIANLVNSLDLSLVVLGGVICRRLGASAARRLEDALYTLTLAPTTVELGKAEYSGIVGMAMIASNHQTKTIL